MAEWYGLFRLVREQPDGTLVQGMVNFLGSHWDGSRDEITRTNLYVYNGGVYRMTGSYDPVNNHLLLSEAAEHRESFFHVRAYSGRLIQVPPGIIGEDYDAPGGEAGLVGTYRDLRVAPEWATISPFIGAWYAVNFDAERRLYSARDLGADPVEHLYAVDRFFADPPRIVEITGHWMLAREDPEGNGSMFRFSIESAVPEREDPRLSVGPAAGRLLVAGELVPLGARFQPAGERIPITGAYDPAANHLHFSEPPKQVKSAVTTRVYEARLISSGPLGSEGMARGWAGTHSEVTLDAHQVEGERIWTFGRRPFTGGWFAEIDTSEAYGLARPPTPHEAPGARP